MNLINGRKNTPPRSSRFAFTPKLLRPAPLGSAQTSPRGGRFAPTPRSKHYALIKRCTSHPLRLRAFSPETVLAFSQILIFSTTGLK